MPRAYPEEFRRRAIELARQHDKPITQIAADLGVAQSASSLARVFGPALAGLAYGSKLGMRSPFTLGCVGMLLALVVALPLRERDTLPG